ncbi:hypothetical protein BT96DRAFT_981774 [Gymnopus androsaceus JB14]|uniref:F-box domain-containing protein n=1 Tax=Gymnopus androsaceus JB14 TaxID=1447944 RepID=A0A6A4GKT1_9AGAR|nr:hypothetical protein BT96DRAFT_981774 [Gymnopus androsaceus JB14]
MAPHLEFGKTTNLFNLPEELLSYICDETDLDSLIPLVESCKTFNRIAGSNYLRRAPYNPDKSWLRVSTQGREEFSENLPDNRPTYTFVLKEISFDALKNLTCILGSMRDIKHIHVTFSESAPIPIQQMRVLVLTLRRIHHILSSISVIFTGQGPSSKPSESFSSFNELFEDMIQEVQRTQCRTLRIQGIVPLAHGSFDFNPPVNRSLTHFLIAEEMPFPMVITEPFHHWLVRFINSSPAISSLEACCSEEWTRILPVICLPSLQSLGFYGPIPSTQTDMQVLAEFSNRHRGLNSLFCGRQVKGFSASPSVTGWVSRLTRLTGTVSQLCCILSPPSRLPALAQITIDSEKSADNSFQLWDLFALLCKFSTVMTLRVSLALPDLQGNFLAEDTSSLSLRSKFPHIRSLQFSESLEFLQHSTIQDEELVRWASQVFPSTRGLQVSALPSWTSSHNASFARAVAQFWPSVKTLAFDFKTKDVEAWYQDGGSSALNSRWPTSQISTIQV